jgi:hypothetical protein
MSAYHPAPQTSTLRCPECRLCTFPSFLARGLALNLYHQTTRHTAQLLRKRGGVLCLCSQAKRICGLCHVQHLSACNLRQRGSRHHQVAGCAAELGIEASCGSIASVSTLFKAKLTIAHARGSLMRSSWRRLAWAATMSSTYCMLM